MADGSWIAFNLNASFLTPDSPTDYPHLIERLTGEGLLEVNLRRTYQHRLLTDGTPIDYVAFIGRKRGLLR